MYSLSKTFNLVLSATFLLSMASLNPPSVLATTTPDEDDPLAKFIFSLKVKRGVAKSLTTRTCKWLARQNPIVRSDICDGGLEYPGGGSAAETCPVTCTEENLVTPFMTREELQQAVDDYCDNPEAWEDHDDFGKYG